MHSQPSTAAPSQNTTQQQPTGQQPKAKPEPKAKGKAEPKGKAKAKAKGGRRGYGSIAMGLMAAAALSTAEGLCMPLHNNLAYSYNNSYPALPIPINGGNSTFCNFAEGKPSGSLFGFGLVAAPASMTLEALLKTRKVHFQGQT